MEKFTTNTVVIGAGVVGLAIAKENDAKLFYPKQNLLDNRAQNMLYQQNLIV